MVWYEALAVMPHGNGYAPVSLTCVWNGGAVWQNSLLGPARPVMVESSGVPSPPVWMSVGPPAPVSTLPATSQLSNTSRPVLVPPCRRTPCGSRMLTATSTPEKTSVWLPKFFAKVTRLLLGTPNLLGLMSVNPQSSYPPPFGNLGSTGAVMQYVLKSEGFVAKSSVTRKFPHQCRTYVALSEIPDRSSCCTPVWISHS